MSTATMARKVTTNGNGHVTKVKPVGVSSEVVRLTPQLAEEWKEKLAKNRPLMESVVLEYADAICRGEWQMNGEAIIFDDHENVIDGQHRIHAVILSGKSIDTLVVRGVKSKAFHTLDQHSRRTRAQILAVEGEAYYNHYAGALSWLWRYNNGQMASKTKTASRGQFSTSVMLRERSNHPGLRDSVHFICGTNYQLSRFASLPLSCTLHYIFSQKDKDKADAFFEKLCTGENLNVGNPIYILRERLISNRAELHKFSSVVQAALIVKTWNAFRASRKLGQLKYAQNESFPEVE